MDAFGLALVHIPEGVRDEWYMPGLNKLILEYIHNPPDDLYHFDVDDV